MKDFFSLIRTVRRKKYDVTIDLRGEPFAALLGFLSGARDRIGFEKEEVGGFLYTQRLRYDRDAHETERYGKIISLLGGRVEAWKPRIYLTESEVTAGEKLIREASKRGYVVMHTGAGLPYKIWPKEHFLEIVQKTLKEFHLDIFLLGGKGEKEIGDYITGAIKDERVKNMAGRLSLRESYFVITRAKAFLGNDSALAHFAGAADIPTIDLMNAVVSENRWRPLGKKSVVISRSEAGHRCGYDHCPYPCPNMRAITTKEVWEKWEQELLD
jgi:ADP-heptose:LPS heptosyltransferase